MSKKKKKQFKFLNLKKTFLIILILFFSVGVAYAINSASSGFRASKGGGTTQVDSHGVCKKVINNRGEEVFVPTKAANEWSLFRTNLPSGVSLDECCVSNYGASCGGNSCKYAGSINCGGSCTGVSNKPNGTACPGGTCSNGSCVAPVINHRDGGGPGDGGAGASSGSSSSGSTGGMSAVGGMSAANDGGTTDGGIGPGGGSSCFPAGTLVDMADGTQKVIEDVKVGEKVISFNLDNKEKVVTTVNEIETPVREGLYTLVFEDNSILEVTNEHPLYVKKINGETGWASIVPKASEVEGFYNLLKVEMNDSVFTNELTYKKIINISYQKGEVHTYNLKNVDKEHNFFAGGVLVHNKGGRVLCTEAYERGMISEEMHQVDKDFAREYADSAVMRGYHSWANPLVRIIKTNDDLADVVLPLAIEWSKHASYKMGVLPMNSEIGEILVGIGLPLCEEIGAMMLEDGNLEYEFSEEDVEREVTKYLGDFRLKELTLEEARVELKERLTPFLLKAKEIYITEER